MADHFTQISAAEAPDEVRGVLRSMHNKHGIELNLFAGLANAPSVLRGYVGLAEIFSRCSLSSAEQQVVQLTVAAWQDSAYCQAMHTGRAREAWLSNTDIEAIRAGQPLSDERLEALRLYIRSVLDSRGRQPQADLDRFLAAGYQPAQALEVSLGIMLAGLACQADHLMQLPIDERFGTQKEG